MHLAELPADRHGRVLVAVARVGDVDMMTGEDVVAELDRLVRDDPAALADEATITDPEARCPPAGCTRHDSGRERGVRPDDAPRTHLDVLLAEERGHGEADRRPLTETAEAARPRAPGPDGGEAAEPLPGRLR